MTLVVFANVVFGDQPCVQLDVASAPAITELLHLYRIHDDDGSRHKVLTVERQPKLIGGTWTGFDYHAPFNRSFSYQAISGDDQISPVSASEWLASDSFWLIHPSTPSLSVLVDMVTAVDAYQYEDTSQVFRVLGKRLPVVRTDYPRGGETGAITILCESPASRAALKKLLAASGPVLLNTPLTDDDLGWKWIQPGNLSIENPGPRVTVPVRLAKLPYREVEQPDADVSPVWTFDDITALGKTFDQLNAYYSNFRDMTLDLHA